MTQRVFRRYFVFSGIVLWCLFSSGLALGQSTPAFWQAKGKNNSVYLLGSMHFGLPNFFPLPALIDKAYSQSGKLAVEVDITALQPVAVSAAIQKYGMLPKGQSLNQFLAADASAALARYCRENQLSADSLQALQPWLVALQLVQVELQKSSLQPQLGIDYYFLSQRNKPVVELETMANQFALFADFSLVEQEFFLTQTLADLQRSSGYLMEMADAWSTGDTEQLEKILLRPFQQEAKSQKLYKKLFSDRNTAMATQVRAFLMEDADVFFVVGAGHMLGDDGIIAILRRSGITVERVHDFGDVGS